MTYVDCRDSGACRFWTTQGNCGCPYCGTETLRRVSSRYSAYASQHPLAPDVPGDGYLVPMSEREVDAARAAGWWVSEPQETCRPQEACR